MRHVKRRLALRPGQGNRTLARGREVAAADLRGTNARVQRLTPTLRSLALAAERLAADGIVLHYTDLVKAMAPIEKAGRAAGGRHARRRVRDLSMMLYIVPDTIDIARAVKDDARARAR